MLQYNNVLILGSGGREHAIAWKLAQSPLLGKLYIAPGNAGTAQLGENLAVKETEFGKIREIVLTKEIGLVVVGPEIPLVEGIHDFFLADPELKHIPVIGPVAAAARLEGSKDFAKQFMVRHNVPTAAYQSFVKSQQEQAFTFLESLKPPYVLKADGLAAGKGVLICASLEEAKKELADMLENSRFGQASTTVVIEEFLSGIELSAFVLTDGNSYVILPEAKDYKRIGEGDTGPNTGGMGAVSPVPFADASFLKKIEDRIMIPTVNGLKADGIDYVGFIFFGIMNVAGEPYVIEYNARMGDPETEAVMPRIKNDLFEVFTAVAEKKLHTIHMETEPKFTSCVMAVAPGYPASYPKGMEINGLAQIQEGVVFHAGTTNDPTSGKILANGGRVLGMTSFGNTLAEALESTYRLADSIHFEGITFRKDIGKDLQ